jgi:hypothetical protein
MIAAPLEGCANLHFMAFRKNAPTRVIWVICLALYLIAVLAHFRIFHIRGDFPTWAWIIGYALLLVATTLRRL